MELCRANQKRHRRFFPCLLLVLGVPLLGVPGCIATRGWVQEQTAPLVGRVSAVEARLVQTDGKAEKALANLDQLQLERHFVLELKDGANFAPNSTALSDQARRAIDSFLGTLQGTGDSLFLVAGHTDNVGSDEYNYELGQKRATSVARYLITQKRIEPLQVAAVSYGKNAPLSNNATAEGRRKNRRIEILVYKEAITTASSTRQHLDLRRSSQSAPSP